MTAKIEPWMIDAMKSLHCAEYYTDAMAERDARHIAAHAPQEPPEWEAKEKALRELANEWASFSWGPFMNPAARLKAILNTPAASGGRT